MFKYNIPNIVFGILHKSGGCERFDIRRVFFRIRDYNTVYVFTILSNNFEMFVQVIFLTIIEISRFSVTNIRQQFICEEKKTYTFFDLF